MKFTLPLMALVLLLLLSGCATPWMTNTKRNAIEQYLISSVVERGISSTSFKDYRNKKVAMDYTYFDPQTDKQYTQGVLELRLAELGMIVVKKAEEADYIIQPLCGVLATDHSKIFLGTPSLRSPFRTRTSISSSPKSPCSRNSHATATGSSPSSSMKPKDANRMRSSRRPVPAPVISTGSFSSFRSKRMTWRWTTPFRLRSNTISFPDSNPSKPQKSSGLSFFESRSFFGMRGACRVTA